MKHWIFQGNPEVFRIDDYLLGRAEILWSVRQTHFADQMLPGDEVFIWRSASQKLKVPAGVIAQGVLVESPRIQKDDWPEGWNAQPERDALRVRIKVMKYARSKKEVIKREWMVADPALGDLRILKMAAQTNYLITPNQAQRLSLLVRNTGRDWTREESIAGMWVYAMLGSGEISRTPGSPVAAIAMQIGRAVTGVYNKVMNFRSIDPRDNRAGMSGGSQVDHQVWDEFYLKSSKQIDVSALDRAYQELWGESVETTERDTDSVDEVFQEGRLVQRKHFLRERNSKLVKIAKQAFAAEHGHLYCEACGFDFNKVYGSRGEDFIEAHHDVPLSTYEAISETQMEDIRMLCSNCHRIVHRTRPWLTVMELSRLLK